MFPSVQKIIQQTALELNRPLKEVELVVMSQFLFIKNQFHTPYYPVIRLENLGMFIIPTDYTRTAFRYVRKRLANHPDSVSYNKALRDIINIRYPAQAYYLSRKFKLRYGSWHYK